MSAINLMRWCDPHDIRPLCQRPHNYQGHTYATNGHACVRVSALPDYEEAAEALRKNVELMRSWIEDAREYKRTNPVMPPLEQCSHCNGGGKASLTKCEECDGLGELEFESDYHTYDGITCQSCKGEGLTLVIGSDQDCRRCHGTGVFHRNHKSNVYDYLVPIEVDGVNVNANLLRLATHLPDVEYSGDVEKSMLYFRSGDAVGIIMGVRV